MADLPSRPGSDRRGLDRAPVPVTPDRLAQRRAALALVGDRVYVAFGGLYGDCGDYRGAIVGVHADGSGPAISYRVPAQREGAIWAPAGMAADSGGSLFVATGNTPATGAFD